MESQFVESQFAESQSVKSSVLEKIIHLRKCIHFQRNKMKLMNLYVCAVFCSTKEASFSRFGLTKGNSLKDCHIQNIFSPPNRQRLQ